MTTHLEHSPGMLSTFMTTPSRFPADKESSSLLAMAHASMDGVIVVDAAHQIVLVNQTVERMFGYPARQVLDKPLETLLPARAGERRRIERFAAARTGSRNARMRLKGRHMNGEELALNASVSSVKVHGEAFLVLVLHEPESAPLRAKQPSSDLRKWAVSSQQANEVEKRRISKKLYDDIGQRLSVLKLDLDWLENSLPDTGENMPERVAQMQGLLDNVITMTKNVASTLRPPLLDDFGLLAAVEWMADSFQKKTGVPCRVTSSSQTIKPGDTVESAVFRVVQEALANIEKHAQAQTVSVDLVLTGDQLDVMIRDDGIGMAEGSENKPGCYGLIVMQQRIVVLGGKVTIRNAVPAGLSIHVSVPIESSSQTAPENNRYI